MEQELIVTPGQHALPERHVEHYLANGYRFVSSIAEKLDKGRCLSTQSKYLQVLCLAYFQL